MSKNISESIQQLKSLAAASGDVRLQRAVAEIGDLIQVGNITNASGVAIGHDIRMVVNHLNVSPETVAALLSLRNQASIALGVDPNKYRFDVEERTEGFVGRQHVFKAIEDFLTGSPGGYLMITADPGMGKTTLLAEYVRRNHCIAHFNVRGQGIVEISKFLESICAQLIVDFGLPHTSLPPDALQDGRFLQQLLKEASKKLESGERLVIAIDALDEVAPGSQASCTNILCLPTDLPKNVYAILTRRPVDIPFLAAYSEFNLMDFSAENRADVVLYLQQKARGNVIRKWIQAQGMKQDEFVERLTILSESNFMYLHHILPEIENGQYHDRDMGELPRGLMGYYRDHWRHMGMESKPLPREKILVVYILSEAAKPVSCKRISDVLRFNGIDIDEIAVQSILNEWDQFLHKYREGGMKRYSIYHASFQDFLHQQDVVQMAGLTIKDVNQLLAEELLDGWRRIIKNE